MSLFITSLNSGSNGNCYYIGNETEAILVDAGISCREIENRMKRLGLYIEKVKAIFVSHEHSDHIKGVALLSKKYNLLVYTTIATMIHGGLTVEKNLVVLFNAHEQINIGGLSIIPFPKLHDACDPYSFIISCNNTKVGVFTDIGGPCKNLINHFKQCHAAFLETNYDDVMLEQGSYPYYLKRRITGGMGHLSNKQALDLFINHKPSFMSHLFLSHLSKNNNCPNLVQNLFNTYANGVQIIVASRYEEIPVSHITNSYGVKSGRKTPNTSSSQLAFSFS
jgi:phosphoribosyl 1,2-cyclic phosphodiesterase